MKNISLNAYNQTLSVLMSSFKFIYFFHVVVEVVELLTKLFIREV